MKKEYVKPMIFIEDFKVDQFIAGSCRDNGPNFVISSENRLNCTVVIPGMSNPTPGAPDDLPILLFHNDACNKDPEDLCYQNMLQTTNYFNS